MKRLVSGIQPTGNLHLGNYLGAIKNWLELQDKYQCFYFIADLHALTQDIKPEDLKKQSNELIVDLLALGIDPKKSTLFRQSDIIGHSELAWIFNCLMPVSELNRMTQFKDKSGIQKDFKNNLENIETSLTQNIIVKNIGGKEFIESKKAQTIIIKFLEGIIDQKQMMKANSGLLTYPVLQAADILIYHGEVVPIGEDQLQHLELTRLVAQKFNNRYQKYFAEVKAILSATPRVMSLNDPEKKMSKSLGPASYIAIRDSEKEIMNKIKKAITTEQGVKNLLELYSYFGDKKKLQQMTKDFQDNKLMNSQLKEELSLSLIKFLQPIQIKIKALEKNPKKVAKIMNDGAKSAQKIVDKNLKEIKKIIGF